MSEPSEKDSGALRARARERIEQGRLPGAKALRTWGGLGSGLQCDLCDAVITGDEPEFELQLDLTPSGEPVRFHRLCHTLWNEAREVCEPSGWRLVSRELPPSGVVVEARVSLGAQRSLILSVVCLSSAPRNTGSAADAAVSAGPAAWLNETTGAPLPEGWLPVEWRPVAGASSASLPGSNSNAGAAA
ncbi:MAG: hypothetical protein ACREUT_02035 [Steroidobacteraceae bacterium]